MTATDKRIFDYETPQAEAHEIKAKNINPYLVDAPDCLLRREASHMSMFRQLAMEARPLMVAILVLTPDEKN